MQPPPMTSAFALHLGAAASVLQYAALGSASSLRAAARLGSTCSVFEEARLASQFSVLQAPLLGPGLPLGSSSILLVSGLLLSVV